MRVSIATQRLMAGALAVAVTLSAGGCLVISDSSNQEFGVRISEPTLAQIEIGVTTEQWVIATFGAPSERSLVAGTENVEIISYDYKRTRKSGGAVFLIFAGDHSEVTKTTAYFEFTDSIVTRCWMEG